MGGISTVINIATLIDRAGTWYGDAQAVLDERGALTFAQVVTRSSRLANSLRHLNPQSGSRVALLLHNRAEFVECDFGIAKAGKVRVPINPRLVHDERKHILNNSDADILVADASLVPEILATRFDLPALKHVIVLDEHVRGTIDYESMLSSASPVRPEVVLSLDDPNFILYTSGTTGKSKGATVSTRGRLCATSNMWIHEIEAAPGDAMVHIGSMSHGSGSKVLAYFAKGARNIAVSRFDPEEFLTLVERERATATFMVPTMITMLLEAVGARDANLTSLKTVSYGGAPIAPERLKEAIARFGNVFVQVYGSCEAPHPVLVLDKQAHAVPADKENRLSAIGREVVSAEVRIVHEDGTDAKVGEPGEMWIRGSNVMTGYWDNQDATREAFVGEWYKTGDIAYRDSEGFCYMAGRARDLIITGGLNVYPAEVEAALHKHPAVLDAAVIGIPDSRWGEAVTAFIVLRRGVTVNAVELIDHCRPYLAGYKKPKNVFFVDQLPKGSTGKVLKRELRDSFWEGRDRSIN
jgi:long-chain acyl-CoA synthetase